MMGAASLLEGSRPVWEMQAARDIRSAQQGFGICVKHCCGLGRMTISWDTTLTFYRDSGFVTMHQQNKRQKLERLFNAEPTLLLFIYVAAPLSALSFSA
jgi:hypothetical protein